MPYGSRTLMRPSLQRSRQVCIPTSISAVLGPCVLAGHSDAAMSNMGYEWFILFGGPRLLFKQLSGVLVFQLLKRQILGMSNCIMRFVTKCLVCTSPRMLIGKKRVSGLCEGELRAPCMKRTKRLSACRVCMLSALCSRRP